MRRHSNPWPALADLFSVLMMAGLAGFVVSLLTQAHLTQAANERVQAEDQLGLLATRIRERVRTLSADLNAEQCSDDSACIDLHTEFASDADTLASTQQDALLIAVGAIVREELDGAAGVTNLRPDTGWGRHNIEVVIEGHTDSDPPVRFASLRDRDIYNWQLSARRATTVLYQFSLAGLRIPEYQILAAGFADSKPRDREHKERNRRTSLRLRLASRPASTPKQ